MLICYNSRENVLLKYFEIPSRRLKAFQRMLEHANTGHIRTFQNSSIKQGRTQSHRGTTIMSQ